VCVSGDDVDFCTHLLELGVVVGSVFDLCGAVESKGCGHENEHIPLAFDAFVRNFYELAVVVSLGLEFGYSLIDDTHWVFPFRWVETILITGVVKRK
jgi:hypothetical protein